MSLKVEGIFLGRDKLVIQEEIEVAPGVVQYGFPVKAKEIRRKIVSYPAGSSFEMAPVVKVDVEDSLGRKCTYEILI